MTRPLMCAAIAAALTASLPTAALAGETEQHVQAPDRIAAARQTVDYLFPLGTYARIMDKTMSAVIGLMMDSVSDIPMREMVAAAGLADDEVAHLGEGTIREIMEILDPAYKQRLERSMQIMMSETGTLMARFEPSIREGLTNAYARRFDAAQLAEMNAFFATPTGTAYAADSMVIFMDPEVMQEMQGFVPEMMAEMPALMGKVMEATADLPAPRKVDELTEAELERLSALIGVPADELAASDAQDSAE